MRIKIRPEGARVLATDEWLRMNGSPAGLRDEGRAEPTSNSDLRPEAPAAAPPDRPANWAEARAHTEARAHAQAGAHAQARAHAQTRAHAQAAGRAVIGDQLRIPITWCEMGSCISWHADPAALGEVDNRARAIHAGWRVDALGRMACPRCLQTASGFRSSRPVVPWDRYTAIAMAARPAVRRDRTIGAARGNSRVPAARAAAVNPPGRRSGDDTASTWPPAPFLPAGRHAERQPAPPFPQRGADRGPDPASLRYGRTAPGRPVSRERA
jgi:hypothetical protein